MSDVAEYLEDASTEGEFPDRRIKDAGAAWAIAQQLVQEDTVAAQNRSIIDGMVDGKPPYNQADLDEAGQSERVNINTKDSAALEEQAVRAYYDLLTSVESIISVETKYGDEIQQPEWSSIISKEFTDTMRKWNLFNLRVSNLHTQYVRHGVAASFFDNEIDWRFRTCGLADLKLRRNTPAAEDEIDLVVVQTPYTVSQLYCFIKDEEAAKESGWNVEVAREIILQSVNTVQERTGAVQYQNWEYLERQIKENDLYYGGNDYHIWVYHLWVKEFNGKITHMTIPQIEGTGGEFLFENRCRYEDIHQALTIFTYGIGDGTYHTIRGMGWKIFDQEQAYTRLWNTALDGAMGNSVTMLQPVSGANVDLQKVALAFNGPFAIIPGGYEVVNRTIPDYSKSVIPVLGELKGQIRNNTVTYQGSPNPTAAENMPVKNYAAYTAQEASLTESALDLWYAPWQRLMTEVFRRMQNPDYGPEDPGFKEVNELKKRLKAKHVPLEAFYMAHNVKVVRAVGSGSKMARLAAYDQAISYGGSTDEEGRYNLIRDRNALVLGQDQIDRYWRPSRMRGAARFNQDQKNAEFENAFFKQGNPGFVSPSDNHTLHCAAHDGLIAAAVEGVQQGGNPDPQALEFTFKLLQVVLPHFQEHIKFMSQDPARQQETKYYSRSLQKAGATLQRIKDTMVAMMENQQKQMQAEQQRAMEAEQARIAALEEKAAKAESSDPKENLKLQKAIMDHQQKLKMAEQEFALKQQHMQAEMAQKLAFKDVENATNMLKMGKVNPYEE